MPPPSLCESEAANFAFSVPCLEGITVPGNAKGSAYPEAESTTGDGNSRKHRLTCDDTRSSKACRDRDASSPSKPSPRERVLFSDAERVRERVVTCAAQLGLRGARKWVLAAILTLLCERWSKITDDRMRLNQIVDEIMVRGGRRYDVKTVGRALSALAADELITYRSAQGRGGFAEVAIHRRFVRDIEVLKRDDDGQVIVETVTFSRGVPSTSRKGYLTTLHTGRNSQQRRNTRPTEVDVRCEDVRYVLNALPEPLADLPRHLRWLLGREIKARLARGFLPAQILAILRADYPETVTHPYRLAVYRLRQNMLGTGPRLRPLQDAWDRRNLAEESARAEERKARWYGAVIAATKPHQREQILRAHQVRFGQRITDPIGVLAAAGRRVKRLYPTVGLTAGLARWCSEVLDAPAAPGRNVGGTPVGEDLTTELIVDRDARCVVDGCGAHNAIARPQLPLKSMVCERCWPEIEAQLLGRSDELAGVG